MNNFLQKLWNTLKYDIKLKNKLLISNFILIMLPLMLITYILTTNSSNYMQTQMKHSSDQVLQQSIDLIAYKIEAIIQKSDNAFFNSNLNQTLKKNENAPVSPQLVEDYYNIRSMISNAYEENTIKRITLYVKNSVFFSTEKSAYGTPRKVAIGNLNELTDFSWYKRLVTDGGKSIWLTTEYSDRIGYSEKCISNIRFIRDMSDYSKNVGVLRIDIPQNDIADIVKKSDITQSGVSILINSYDEIICASNDKRAGIFASSQKQLRNISHKGAWEDSMLNDEEVLIASKPVKNTDWYLISIIKQNEIHAIGNNMRNQMIVIMLIIAIVSYFLAFVISNSITKRLQILSKNMRFITDNQFAPMWGHSGKDEVCSLISGYNYMITKLDEYSHKQYSLGEEVKNAEFKALQAQINPHFLYNTLDLIKWKAQRYNVPDISNIVMELAKYYRLSLNNGNEIVTIEDELLHIKTYIALQNYRFKDAIHLEIFPCPELYHFSIPKLLLQPIIENCVLHGIMQKPEKCGIIKISITLSNETLDISIEDNGIGMTKQQLHNVFSFPASNQNGGYGIVNVDHRIKLKFGTNYGLFYNSTPGVGTIVDLRIPATLIR